MTRSVFCYTICAGTLVLLSLFSVANSSRLICDNLNPTCGLNATEAQRLFLTPYTQILPKLRAIKAASKVDISIGPLIKNGEDSGLLNIDTPINSSLYPNVNISVCGPSNPAPTIREAVICTVTQNAVQPPRGNTNPSQIGKSTQGRTIYAARLGNRRGQKVIITTQLHGNEPAGTESAFRVLSKLTTRRRYWRRILRRLDLLFVVRVNVDGGEPTANAFPSLGTPFLESSGFFRQNVDPSAGGGFVGLTEEDFFGVVGRGYDLNRYNYVALDQAVRPVESQSLVAVVHAFQPHFIFDLHGDVQKTVCEVDPESVVPNDLLGILPSAKCRPPTSEVPTLVTERERMVESSVIPLDEGDFTNFPTAEQRRSIVQSRFLASSLVRSLDPLLKGSMVRFSQLQVGAGRLSGGLFSTAGVPLSAVGLALEVTNFGTALRPAVLGVTGAQQPVISPDTFLIEPCYLLDNICIYEALLEKTLSTTGLLAQRVVEDDLGFCSIPFASANVVSFPSGLGWPTALVRQEATLVPSSGEFGVPVQIIGSCPGDPSVEAI
eukprot:GFKZ01003701.1.p1 GENE.GFKZ01003701.1~~GFKZ01003701.1.p1  ORF type:complete len:549 (-),score=47.80 GFKZ01003701.1:256-1902(-)